MAEWFNAESRAIKLQQAGIGSDPWLVGSSENTDTIDVTNRDISPNLNAA